MNYKEAHSKAKKIRSDLCEFCSRIEIAGSIRRGKQEGIKDVEIVCISKKSPIYDMFGTMTHQESILELSIREILSAWRATTTKNGKAYKQIIFPDATKLDLFIVTQETWGVIFTLRTGPAEYSKQLVTPRKYGGLLPSHLSIKDGRVWHGENALETPEEKDFFNVLGIDPMPEPSCRIPKVYNLIQGQHD